MAAIKKLRNKICFVAPNPVIAGLAKDVSKKFSWIVEVYVGNLSNGVQAARQALASGSDIIISRGGTAYMIEKELQIPVINIVVSGVDLIKTLDKVKQYDDKFGIIGYENLLVEMQSNYHFLNSMLYVGKIKDYQEIRGMVQRLHQNYDVQVFIGGEAVVKTAEEMGFKGVLLECGIESIRRAVMEARLLAETKLRESERYLQFKAISEHSSEGIIFFDEYGKVRYFNPITQNIFSNKTDSLLGLTIDKLLPQSKLVSAVRDNKAVLSSYEYVNGIKIIARYIPLNLNNVIIGGILSFQDVTRIEELEKKIRREQYTKGLVAKYNFSDIKTKDPKMQQIISNARRISKSESSVLITGESGTGKELFAQSIHNESLRKNGPFVAINCAALPESLLESELFGYVEGSFTGARKNGKPGLFELAHMGTIFLDEIGDMPFSVQSHLLRVIQEREVTRIGDDKVIPVNIRVIAATNKDLSNLIKLGKFRKDLYYRLDIIRIKLPLLRERIEDLPYLCNHFLEYYCKLSRSRKKNILPGALDIMKNYSWPGNIRELQNFVESLVIMAEDEDITDRMVEKLLLDKLDYAMYCGIQKEQQNQPPSRYYAEEGKGLLHALEYQSIQDVLEQVRGDKAMAAKILGISTTTLWRRLKKM